MDQGDEFNLALFDLFMPGMSGPGSLKTMRSNSPKTRFAVISASQDRRDIIATISAGLNGFIPKSLPDGDIAGAIRIILGSQIYVPGQLAGSCSQPSLATSPTERLSRLSSDFVSGQTPDLTPRQRDVLEAVRQGLTNKEIARNLAIAEGTVKIHLAGLFAAFGVRNRTELAVCN